MYQEDNIFHRLTRPLRRGFSRIKRFIAWFPIIWNDEDWDFNYLLDILSFKLNRMRNCIKDNNYIVSSNAVYDEITVTMKHIDEYKNNLDMIESPECLGRNSEFVDVGDGFKRLINNYTRSEERQIKKYYKELARLEEKSWKDIWESISNNMRKWWD